MWNETALLDTFPEGGLRVKWRTPVRGGYAGPAVSDDRVFVTDFSKTGATNGIERVLCLDEESGKVLWSHEWEADYRGIDYATGPRATPTVDGDRVYTLGAMGALHCLNAKTGKVLWKKNYAKDYGTAVPAWGMSSAPVIDGDRLIAVVGGTPDAKVVAFDKKTGQEIWRALSSVDSEPGYSQPILIEAGGRRQLVVWHATAIHSLDPSTGRVYWSEPFRVHMNTPIATPVYAKPHLLISQFFHGARMMELDPEKPQARLLWRGHSDSETSSDTLHALMASPVVEGDYIYGICSYGQLRCLKRSTGERVWETQEVTREKVRNASAFLVRQAGRFWISNDRGELIIARMSPEGYREIDRTPLIRPTSPPGSRREFKAVSWSHPAFANRHVFARNDEEILCASLEAPQ